MFTREDIEKREAENLAPYAMKSAESRGRKHKEAEHGFRSVYQRDRDRIVFVNHEGDYYRTRLTHTLEVAQIARTIARALRLNEDLVEATALAHDLGHTPFGHSGEDTLAELMKDHGGFDHNTHGLRVVDVLEKRYPGFCGLNLTEEVRRGIIRHSTPFDEKRAEGDDIPGPYLMEIQVVNVSDEIAYDNHDLDDGLKSGLLEEGDLQGVQIWKDAAVSVDQAFQGLSEDTRRYQIIRHLINLQVSDVVENSQKRIKDLGIEDISSFGEKRASVVAFSGDLEKKRSELKEVLLAKLYEHYRVKRMSYKASLFLKSLFKLYYNNPELLPPPQYMQTIKGTSGEEKYRGICDYMAGMTDRYALDQYKMFFEPYERV